MKTLTLCRFSNYAKDLMKDPEKEILINNIINSNENFDSEFYLISYEEKIAEISADTYIILH